MKHRQARRHWLVWLAASSAGLALGSLASAQATKPSAANTPASALPTVVVWKGPACGCCKDWIVHLERHGFKVTSYDTGNTDARQRLGMPTKFGSCHTARVGNYVIEGHVPAADIQRLLRERPVALGLAVPSMPVGSPGMDGPEYGNRFDPYDVLLIQRDGTSRVFNHYPNPAQRKS